MTTTTLPAWMAEFPPVGDQPSRMLAKCSRCRKPHAIDVHPAWASAFYSESANGPRGEYIRCGCGRALTVWRQVKGRPGVAKCDARCTGARGPDCECQCVGRNHGKDHLL